MSAIWEAIMSLLVLPIAMGALAGVLSVASLGTARAAQMTLAQQQTANQIALIEGSPFESYAAPTTTPPATPYPSVQDTGDATTTFTVQNYGAGQSPAFATTYPASNLQKITVTTTVPGSAPITVSTYKDNPAA